MAESRPGVPSVQQSRACLLAALSEHELAPVDLICRSRPQGRTAANPKGGARETPLTISAADSLPGWMLLLFKDKEGDQKAAKLWRGKEQPEDKENCFL